MLPAKGMISVNGAFLWKSGLRNGTHSFDFPHL
jgi:hypothetical protein